MLRPLTTGKHAERLDGCKGAGFRLVILNLGCMLALTFPVSRPLPRLINQELALEFLQCAGKGKDHSGTLNLRNQLDF